MRAASRLIPAHAGKTAAAQPHAGSVPAHPRSRGENLCLHLRRRRLGGSSPLTRGKLPGPRNRPAGGRLIPAHAGKTNSIGRPGALPRAHPRSRGENFLSSHLLIIGNGSSPLTRGKLGEIVGVRVRGRLIPAHAGKTCCSTTWGRTYPAHPRSRGENHQRARRQDRWHGSSPLTRGKPG